MDWYVDTAAPEAVTNLRHAFRGYLERHALEGEDLDAAETAFSELVTNALVHARTQVWVSVDWSGVRPRVTVYDLGPGFTLDTDLPADPLATGGRGLFIAAHLTARLEVAARRGGGSAVTADMLVRRSMEESHDPPLATMGALPALVEAGEDGFGSQAFLRALVVQLAQTLERNHGPGAAEAAVAQVGTDVGGQMEQEYRRAREVHDRLDPEMMADAYVRLKHAIGGGFFVIEQTDDRIVLGNDRCPFGDDVRRSPSLCRMTSSVFGGIAARNCGEATVLLEERIAVGDPGCRIVVRLGPAEPDAPGHVYRAPRTAEGDR